MDPRLVQEYRADILATLGGPRSELDRMEWDVFCREWRAAMRLIPRIRRGFTDEDWARLL